MHVFTTSLAKKQGSTPEILVKNIADFERPFKHAGVAHHPGDAAIADALAKALPK